MAGDGEGATALFEVKIIGAESKEQAKVLSKSVITSSLTDQRGDDFRHRKCKPEIIQSQTGK